jgi:hypothetical protein
MNHSNETSRIIENEVPSLQDYEYEYDDNLNEDQKCSVITDSTGKLKKHSIELFVFFCLSSILLNNSNFSKLSSLKVSKNPFTLYGGLATRTENVPSFIESFIASASA